MKEFLTKMKADFLLASFFCIIFGIIFIVWNKATLAVIGAAVGTLAAVVLIIIGAAFLCSYFFNVITSGFSAAIGAVLLIIGIWILVNPSIIVALIPVVIGLVLLIHGIRDMKESLEAKKYGYNSWGVGIVLAIINVIFGVICIIDAFGVLKLATVLIGIALIYNGVSNIWLALGIMKAEKDYRNKQEPIDVEFK